MWEGGPDVRIAHIGPTSLPIGFQFGGAVERRMLELARAQAQQGDEVVIYSVAPDAAEGPEALAAVEASEPTGSGDRPRTVVPIRCRSRRPVRDLELPARARAELKEFGAQVVHVHNNWSIARVLTGLDIPTALSFDYYEYRGSNGRVGRHAYQWAVKAFDLLMPVSTYCGSGAAEHWRVPRSRFDVLPNGVNMAQFRPDPVRRAAARAALGYRNDEVVIGYVGRVCEQKGTDLLASAYQELVSADPSVRLLVAGPTGQFGNHESSRITAQITRAGGRWLGPVPEEQLADTYRAMDVFVLPTRRYEMFGMAAAEALASGTPVVCSRLGGLPEVVSENAGVLFPPGERDALVGALASLCSNSQRRGALGAAARGSVERFAWDRIADQARALYSTVIDPAHMPPTARQAAYEDHDP